MPGLDLDSRVDALVNSAANFVYGKPGTWHPAAAADVAITAIVDQAWVDLKESEGAPVSSVGPALLLQLSQFPAEVTPAQGDTVTIVGTLFNVADLQPDGFGCARVILKLAI